MTFERLYFGPKTLHDLENEKKNRHVTVEHCHLSVNDVLITICQCSVNILFNLVKYQGRNSAEPLKVSRWRRTVS